MDGRVALDLGAAAGGFTRVLLRAGARRVYAVDVGHGQLLGSLRQDERVVVLERTNLAALDRRLVPDEVEVVTIEDYPKRIDASTASARAANASESAAGASTTIVTVRRRRPRRRTARGPGSSS